MKWAKDVEIAEIAAGGIVGIVIGVHLIFCICPAVIWRVFFYVEKIEEDFGLIDNKDQEKNVEVVAVNN